MRSWSRKLFLVSFVSGAVILTGCASMGFTSDPGKLKSQVAFDHDCPAEKVNIVDSAELGTGHASFKVDACGQKYRYERMGSSYFDSAKGSPVDQAMGKSTPATSTPTEEKAKTN